MEMLSGKMKEILGSLEYCQNIYGLFNVDIIWQIPPIRHSGI